MKVPVNSITAILSAAALAFCFSTPAAAVSIEFDLDPSMISGSAGDQTFDSGTIVLDTQITLNQMSPTASIWIDFVDASTVKEHLELIDFPNQSGGTQLPFERFTDIVFGNEDGESGSISLIVTLTDVIGDLDENNINLPAIACSVGTTCATGAVPNSGDLTDTSFVFHDLHFDLTFLGGGTIEIDSIQFMMQANEFRIGVWSPVPEPASLGLLGLSMAGLALGAARRRRKRVT